MMTRLFGTENHILEGSVDIQPSDLAKQSSMAIYKRNVGVKEKKKDTSSAPIKEKFKTAAQTCPELSLLLPPAPSRLLQQIPAERSRRSEWNNSSYSASCEAAALDEKQWLWYWSDPKTGALEYQSNQTSSAAQPSTVKHACTSYKCTFLYFFGLELETSRVSFFSYLNQLLSHLSSLGFLMKR